jgi:hypothetical protein
MKGFAADPLFWGCVLGIGAVLFWWHEHHWQRFTAWLFGASAACFTIAIPTVFDALAALTATPTGLTVLAVTDVAVGVAFYLQAVRTHKRSRGGKLFGKFRKSLPGEDALTPVSRPNRYKAVLTPLVSVLAGAFGVVTFGAWRILTEHASATAAGTFAALGHSVASVNDGTAARAIPHAALQGTYLRLAGAFAVLALVMHFVSKRKRKGGKGASGGRGGMPVMRAQSR